VAGVRAFAGHGVETMTPQKFWGMEKIQKTFHKIYQKG
jgi:hypothetical protein